MLRPAHVAHDGPDPCELCDDPGVHAWEQFMVLRALVAPGHNPDQSEAVIVLLVRQWA